MRIGIDCSRFQIHRSTGMCFRHLSLLSPGLNACCRKRTYLNCFKKPRRACKMKKLTGFLAGCCLVLLGLVTGPSVAKAQDGSGAGSPPPKVLVIDREVLKVG